jgi:hypothetical protein
LTIRNLTLSGVLPGVNSVTVMMGLQEEATAPLAAVATADELGGFLPALRFLARDGVLIFRRP